MTDIKNQSVINTLIREIRELDRKIGADTYSLQIAQEDTTRLTFSIGKQQQEREEHLATLTELGGEMPVVKIDLNTSLSHRDQRQWTTS